MYVHQCQRTTRRSNRNPAQDIFRLLQQLNVAVNSGLAAPALDTVYNCPSGSCTWPAFATLRLCNECHDISTQMLISCSDVTRYRFCKYRLKPQFDDTDETGTLLAWNLWTQDEDKNWVSNTWMNVSTSSASELDMYTQADTVRFEKSYDGSTYPAADQILPTALRCSLKWCAQYHDRSRVHQGDLLDPSRFSATLVRKYPLANESDDPSSQVYAPDSAELTTAQSKLLNERHTEFLVNGAFSILSTGVLGTVLQNACIREQCRNYR